jgi:hypothetical protein
VTCLWVTLVKGLCDLGGGGEMWAVPCLCVTAIVLQTERSRNRAAILGRGKNLSVLEDVQTGSAFHPGAYCMGNGNFFLGG